jgi:hypothetical protein
MSAADWLEGPENAPLSLQAASLALGVNRATLRRWAADGCRGIRRAGKNWEVDPAAVREWLADREAKTRYAPRLDERDPRWRERVAAVKVAEYRAGLKRGELVTRADAIRPYENALASLATDLKNLPSRFGPELKAENIESILADEVADVLARFTPDDPKNWPVPAPAPDESEAAEEDEGAGEIMPILPASDPRTDVILARARSLESQIREFESSVLRVAEMPGLLRGPCDEIRERLRLIPACVALALPEGEHTPSVIGAAIGVELDDALADLGGGTWDDDVEPSRPVNYPVGEDGFDLVNGLRDR